MATPSADHSLFVLRVLCWSKTAVTPQLWATKHCHCESRETRDEAIFALTLWIVGGTGFQPVPHSLLAMTLTDNYPSQMNNSNGQR